MCSRCSSILCCDWRRSSRLSWWAGVTLYSRASRSGYLVTLCTGTCREQSVSLWHIVCHPQQHRKMVLNNEGKPLLKCYEGYSCLRCAAMSSDRQLPKFWRNMLPTFRAKTMVPIYHTTQNHIPEVNNLHNFCFQYLRCQTDLKHKWTFANFMLLWQIPVEVNSGIVSLYCADVGAISGISKMNWVCTAILSFMQ